MVAFLFKLIEFHIIIACDTLSNNIYYSIFKLIC